MYRYSRDNPINFNDPGGTESNKVVDAISSPGPRRANAARSQRALVKEGKGPGLGTTEGNAGLRSGSEFGEALYEFDRTVSGARATLEEQLRGRHMKGNGRAAKEARYKREAQEKIESAQKEFRAAYEKASASFEDFQSDEAEAKFKEGFRIGFFQKQEQLAFLDALPRELALLVVGGLIGRLLKIGAAARLASQGTKLPNVEILNGLSREQQVAELTKRVAGLEAKQAEDILQLAFDGKNKTRVVFGGSRVRGDFRGLSDPKGPSDIDIGFGDLTKNQATKLIKKIKERTGPLAPEEFQIVPGRPVAGGNPVSTPEEFFQRSGVRTAGDRAGEAFEPSGSVTVTPDGQVIILQAGVGL